MKVPALCITLMASALLAIPAHADSPDHFLRQAIRGDSSEIMLGRLAENNGSMRGVREFGRTLRWDHTNALNEATRVARRMDVDFDREPTGEARDEARRLRHMHGGEFDREFVRYMVDDHRKDVADFRDEAREHNGPASRLAERQLPTLEKHLDMALSLQNRMGDGRFANAPRDRDRRFDR